MENFAHITAILTTVLAIAAMGYCLTVLIAVASFRRYAAQPLPDFTVDTAPGITILKPVKGFDPGMYEAFRSHCTQLYNGPYELIFGAGNEDDPAIPAVHQLMAEFPQIPMQLVLCPERLGTNGKVSNLIQILPRARHSFILINDSDIHVSPRYLARVMAQFFAASPKPIGMVTALYRGHASRNASGKRTFGGILEALGIATDFQAGVLVARLVESGIHFGLGSTLAVRQEALAAAGGLEALVDQLADDYEMGARIDKAGYTVRLATEVVETSIPAYNWHGFVSHQLRWTRTVRDSRQWGYVGLLFTHLLPLALVNILASGASIASLWFFGLAFFLRLGTAMQVGSGVLGDRQVLEYLWLLPIRDCIGFALWFWGFAGNTIEWRGERFLLKSGRLVKTEN